MEHKLIPFDLKADDDGAIAGYGSIFGNVDKGGDIVLKGAFAGSLSAGIKPKMLFQHDPSDIIGVWDKCEEDEQGLRVRGRLALGTQRGREVHELVKMGAFDGLSIGYRTVQAAKGQDGLREISEAELWEVSAVTFPMNDAARIDAVKAAHMTKTDFERKLTRNAGFTRSVARTLMGGGLEAVKAMQDAGDGLDELRAALTARAT